MSKYGFVAVPRDVHQALPHPNPPKPHLTTDIPTTKLAKFVTDYTKEKLPTETFNHLIRVYLYLKAIIADQYPQWDLDDEVIYVTAMLHDIGQIKECMDATKMLFEFYGGMLAHKLVVDHTGDRDYADAVCEAIIRHQDLGDLGYITTLGLIIQICTILDNVGLNPELIHKDTLDAVNKAYSRKGWLQCFAGAIDNENTRKPWGHTSKLGVDKFREDVLANKLAYEKL